MKKTITIREKIAVRAYYAWLAGSTASAETHWLQAEKVEIVYAERRAASAAKASATRRAKTAASVPAEMLVAARRQIARRLTAH